ncbi:MAG: oligosaccharide flippase family protein [Flavobacteriales bacterium]|nr:oligosaccharide flippase family protein [Flavobacteriales bacterium]
MIKDLKHTLKQTFLYGLSNIAIKAAGLILVPLYTSSLSKSEYGELALLEITAQFLVGVISLQLPSALLRFGGVVNDASEIKQIYSTALFGALALSIMFAMLAIPSIPIASELIFDSDSFEVHLKFLVISVVLEILGLLPLQLLRIAEKSTAYLLFVSIKLVGLIGFVFYFVVIENEGVLGAIKAITLANAIFLLVTIPLQLRNSKFTFDPKRGRQMARYGGPLIFTTISALLLTISDRLVIKIFGNFSDVGIYTLAYKVGSLSNLLIIASFSLGFLPIAFKKKGEPNFGTFFGKTLTLYILLTTVLTLGVSIFGYELIQLASTGKRDYWTAATLVPFIAYMFIFKAFNNYFCYVFLLNKRTKYHAWVTVSGVLINIALNFIFIKKYGIYGAVAATGISYLFMAIMSYRFASRQMIAQYEYKRVAVIVLSSFLLAMITLLTNQLEIFIKLPLKTVLFLGYLVSLYLFIATPEEKKVARKTFALLKTKNGLQKLLQGLQES